MSMRAPGRYSSSRTKCPTPAWRWRLLLLQALLLFVPGVRGAESAARNADRTVQLERARLALLQARYSDARKLLRPLLAADETQEANYYQGIVCARLGDIPCATSLLMAIIRSPVGKDYPGALLELGAAYAQAGDETNARSWLEQAQQDPQLREQAEAQLARLLQRQRLSVASLPPQGGPKRLDLPRAGTKTPALQLRVTAGLGLDNNPVGDVLQGTEGSSLTDPGLLSASCAEPMDEALHRELCEAPLSRWNLDAALHWTLRRSHLAVGYRLRQTAALTWPEVPPLASPGHFFDLQTHTASLETGLRPGQSLLLKGDAVRAAQPLQLYGLAGDLQFRQQWPPDGTHPTWLLGSIRCELYRDLPRLWNLPGLESLEGGLGGRYGFGWCLPLGNGWPDTLDESAQASVSEDPCVTDASSEALGRFCSARTSGARLRLEVGQQKDSRFWRLSTGYQHSPVLTGPGLTAGVGAGLWAGPRWMILGTLETQLQWQLLGHELPSGRSGELSDDTLQAGQADGGLSLQQLRVSPSLELRLGRSKQLPFTTSLRYTGTGAALYTGTPTRPGGGCEPSGSDASSSSSASGSVSGSTTGCGYTFQFYVRQLLTLEVSYAFQ